MQREQLHDLLSSYLQEWFVDPCGSWWEADISHRLYQHLATFERAPNDTGVVFGSTLRPDFLGRWESPRTKRLSVVNHVATEGRGIYPDLAYRKDSGEGYEWIMEIKHCSPRSTKYATEVGKFVDGMISDAQTRRPTRGACEHLLLLGLVNLPLRIMYRREMRKFDVVGCVAKLRDGVQRVTRELDQCDDMIVAWKVLGPESVAAFGCLSSSEIICESLGERFTQAGAMFELIAR